ncbi:hypothetical protein LTR08_001574 [Meristemomyces frigidus]|nr:hypothetical protein LTR08_001574 [Meristemomyces frigidus]
MNYGVDETRLEGWQRLCDDALKAISVNIVDLVEATRNGQIPHHFPSKGALSVYIYTTGRWFPLKKAKANRFLSALLIEVWG